MPVQETKIKGYVNITGYKVIADKNANPGRYGFRIVHDTAKPHFFSSKEQVVVRKWMKALMKPTILRKYKDPEPVFESSEKFGSLGTATSTSGFFGSTGYDQSGTVAQANLADIAAHLECGTHQAILRDGISGEEEKRRGQFAISEVIEHTQELIKPEEEGGMKMFAETRKGDEASNDTYSTLLTLFDSDPKSTLIKMVGYNASLSPLDEALATVRAKTNEPAVSFTAKATRTPHWPVGERNEPKGALESEEEDKAGSEGTN
ncbi:unnamed protein product, partial [Rhizoctonia solani]